MPAFTAGRTRATASSDWCRPCFERGKRVAKIAARFPWQRLRAYGGDVDPWKLEELEAKRGVDSGEGSD